MAAIAAELGAFVPGSRCRVPPLQSGSLDGMRFVVKDLIDVAGTTTGGGNPDWAMRQQPAARSATAVTRLLSAGATMVGKTITDELAFSLEGENEHYGTPVNPRCSDRLPGGSSSGSAVAVAAGLAELGLGTDTGGSVRVPASFCGIFGYRPSHGRVPMDGVIPFAPSFDTVGLFARNAADLEKAGLRLLASQADQRREFTCVLASDAFALADGNSVDAVLAGARAWGVTNEIEIYAGQAEKFLAAYRVLQGHEIATALGDFLRNAQPRFGATIAPRFTSVFTITAAEAERWSAWRLRMRARLVELLPPGRLLAIPTAPGEAPIRPLRGIAAEHFYASTLTLTSIVSLAGLPAISVPIAQRAGCPLGLSLIAGPGCDEALLGFVARTAPQERAR